jgi:hypothetical protein
LTLATYRKKKQKGALESPYFCKIKKKREDSKRRKGREEEEE